MSSGSKTAPGTLHWADNDDDPFACLGLQRLHSAIDLSPDFPSVCCRIYKVAYLQLGRHLQTWYFQFTLQIFTYLPCRLYSSLFRCSLTLPLQKRRHPDLNATYHARYHFFDALASLRSILQLTYWPIKLRTLKLPQNPSTQLFLGGFQKIIQKKDPGQIQTWAKLWPIFCPNVANLTTRWHILHC